MKIGDVEGTGYRKGRSCDYQISVDEGRASRRVQGDDSEILLQMEKKYQELKEQEDARLEWKRKYPHLSRKKKA